MGTSLGNLQILHAAVEQVAALLPEAVVGQWSERFVTALHPGYQLGTVEREARRLSKRLPEAVVLAAGIFDSDLLGLTVYQGGKRLTARFHDPCQGQNRAGDPKVFCRALELPGEDEKRLRAVWKKGDAEEQLELTGLLLGAPLWCDGECPPEKRAVRDAEAVDRWLAQRPDPPRVKNRTRAQVIQEFSAALGSHDLRGETNGNYLLRLPGQENGFGQLWQPGPEGTLVCRACMEMGWHRRFLEDSGRVLGFEWGDGDEMRLCFDSDGVLPSSTEWRLWGDCFTSHPDGGILVWDMGERNRQLPPEERKKGTVTHIAPDGTVLRTAELPGNYGYVAGKNGERLCLIRPVSRQNGGEQEIYFQFDCCDQEGNLLARRDLPWNTYGRGWDREGMWLTSPAPSDGPGGYQYDLARLSFDLEERGRVRLPGLGVSHTVRSPDRTLALHAGFDEGLWLLDGDTLEIRAALTDKRSYFQPCADGAGRFWVWVGDSTVEAYDRTLTLLSRHRLKGSVMGCHLDSEGRLCAVTYDEKKALIRVWRLS